MKLLKLLGGALIVLSIWMGYVGVNTISDNTNKVNLLGIKIDASNESGQQRGYTYIVLAVVVFAGGAYLISRPNK